MIRLFGRVDFFYVPAPLIMDKRGAIAKSGGEHDLFQSASVLNDGVVLQHPLRECQVRIGQSGAIWRDDHNKNDVLDFVGKHLTSAAVKIQGIRQICNYYSTETQEFRRMVLAMYDGLTWARLRKPNVEDLSDIGIVLDVKLDGHLVGLTMGPMEKKQLIDTSFGTVSKPADFEIPDRAWFLGMQDRENFQIDPAGYAQARPLLSQRLARWNEFAQGLFNLA